MRRMTKGFSVTAISALIVSMILAGCGGDNYDYAREEPASAWEEEAYAGSMAAGSYKNGADYADEYYMGDDVYEYASEESLADEAPEQEFVDTEAINATQNRKLIKTVNLTVETREFDKLIDTINAKVANLGGYIENSNISGNSYGASTKRDGYIVARIPSKSLDSFVTCIEEKSNITNKSENAEDVTLQYSDVEARKASLKIEQERLNELLEQADTLENIIELEERLTEVRYELESYESRLRTMDNQIEYSTVNLNVFEVVEYTPEPVEELTFGQRLGREFKEGCKAAWDIIQDFIIDFLAFLPRLLVILAILAVIFFIVFFIVKGIIALVKKRRVKHPQKPKTTQAPKTPGRVSAVALEERPVIRNENSDDVKPEKGAEKKDNK